MQPAFEEDFMLEGYLHGILQMRPISALVPVIGLYIFIACIESGLGDGKGQMKKEILSAEAPVTIGDITITPLVRQDHYMVLRKRRTDL